MSAGTRALSIVDTHCHTWQLDIVRQTWMSTDLGPLFATYGPDELSEAVSGRVSRISRARDPAGS